MILDQPSGPETPKKEVSVFKVFLINLAVALLFWFFSATGINQRLFHVDTAQIILNQIGFNFFAGLILRFIPKTRALGFAMLISSLLFALIGFGICTATFGR